MRLSSIPLCLFFILNAPLASAFSFSDSLGQAHKFAARHSHNFARDLRLAFGGIVLARDSQVVIPKRVVYCKTRPTSLDGGNGGQGGGFSSNSSFPTTSFRTSTRTTTKGTPKPTPSSLPPSPWKLMESHEGTNFFDGWSFFTAPDPTHGTVQFVDEGAARASKLIDFTPDGNIIMRVDTASNIQGGRQSVRIQTLSHFTGGLVIMDAVHMPTGCGTWPAFWTNGPTWPVTGEIDIVEAVHDYTNNQATIHANPGCKIPSTDSNALKITGTVVGGDDCAVQSTGNQGCGIRAASKTSFGAGFNSIGGGVYAMKWDEDGIAVYFFPSGSVPDDITGGQPQPSNWGLPQARWPAAQCDPFQFFRDHSVIFDTTFCGDWAGATWTVSGVPGQEQSCAQRTGFSSCEAFVRARGDAFHEAYWEVKSVKIYKHN